MPTQEPPSTPPKPAPAAGAVEYLSLPAAARLIAQVGVVECLRGLVEVLEQDFRRWNDFHKSARLAQHIARARGLQLRRAGMEVHRDGHGACGHMHGAAQPYARKEHVGQRRQPTEVKHTLGRVAHPQLREAAVALAVPLPGQGTGHGPQVVAVEPFDARHRRHGLQRVGPGHLGHGHVGQAPGVAARRRDRRGRGGDHGLTVGTGLHDGHVPVLGRTVGAHRSRIDRERPGGGRPGVVDRERQGLTQQAGMQQDGAQRRGRGDAAKGPDHVPVGWVCLAPVVALGQGVEHQGLVKGMGCRHGAECAVKCAVPPSCR